jgi:hypothetical protein
MAGNYSGVWSSFPAWMSDRLESYGRAVIDIDFVTDDQLRAIRDAIVIYRSIRVFDDYWGEYQQTEPVMICRLCSLPTAIKVCERLAADLYEPVFYWKDAAVVSDWDMTRLREHISLEREVRACLKNLELSAI